MRTGVKQWAAASVLVLVAGGALVGCGDKDDAKADQPSGTDLTQADFFDKTAEAQKKAGTSHVTMSVKVAGQELKADGDLKVAGAADTAMAMTMDTGQMGLGSLEMRLVEQVFYLNLGPMTQNKFAKIDLTDPDNPIGRQYGDIVESLDPAKQLEEFKGAVKGFDQKGEPITLDGVKATPYVIVVDTAKLRAGNQEKLPKTVTYTMYVGPDNLPRRLLTRLPGLGGTGSGNTMTIDYSRWGEKVSIEKPKASEVTDQDLLSRLGSTSPSPS